MIIAWSAEFCGIKDYKPSRPVLSPLVDNKTKLFRRYAVIHIDERGQPHRGVHGVNWHKVREYLESKGYFVVQAGLYIHETVAIEINTQSVGLLKFLIAGCDMFIGVDSAPAHIAVAYNKPSVLFFGSVNPNFIHPDLTNVKVIHNSCDKEYCWHTKAGSVEGVPCFYEGTEKYLQCCTTNENIVIDAINELI